MRPEERVGFEGGERVQITERDPSQHSTACTCRRCGREWDATCPGCGSIDVATEGPATAAQRPSYWERYRLLLLEAHDYRNSKFYLAVLFMATGDPAAAGKTMEELAATWGVGKAAVSKLAVQQCKFLGIDPSPYMKAKETKQSYRESNHRPFKQ
jgi:hypothetical protein